VSLQALHHSEIAKKEKENHDVVTFFDGNKLFKQLMM